MSSSSESSELVTEMRLTRKAIAIFLRKMTEIESKKADEKRRRRERSW